MTEEFHKHVLWRDKKRYQRQGKNKPQYLNDFRRNFAPSVFSPKTVLTAEFFLSIYFFYSRGKDAAICVRLGLCISRRVFVRSSVRQLVPPL